MFVAATNASRIYDEVWSMAEQYGHSERNASAKSSNRHTGVTIKFTLASSLARLSRGSTAPASMT